MISVWKQLHRILLGIDVHLTTTCLFSLKILNERPYLFQWIGRNSSDSKSDSNLIVLIFLTCTGTVWWFYTWYYTIQFDGSIPYKYPFRICYCRICKCKNPLRGSLNFIESLIVCRIYLSCQYSFWVKGESSNMNKEP